MKKIITNLLCISILAISCSEKEEYTVKNTHAIYGVIETAIIRSIYTDRNNKVIEVDVRVTENNRILFLSDKQYFDKVSNPRVGDTVTLVTDLKIDSLQMKKGNVVAEIRYPVTDLSDLVYGAFIGTIFLQPKN